MANLRRSSRPGPGLRQGQSPVAAPAPGARLRWPLIAAAVAVVLLGLAWIDGGEEPLHPITQAVDLAEPQQ